MRYKIINNTFRLTMLLCIFALYLQHFMQLPDTFILSYAIFVIVINILIYTAGITYAIRQTNKKLVIQLSILLSISGIYIYTSKYITPLFDGYSATYTTQNNSITIKNKYTYVTPQKIKPDADIIKITDNNNRTPNVLAIHAMSDIKNVNNSDIKTQSYQTDNHNEVYIFTQNREPVYLYVQKRDSDTYSNITVNHIFASNLNSLPEHLHGTGNMQRLITAKNTTKIRRIISHSKHTNIKVEFISDNDHEIMYEYKAGTFVHIQDNIKQSAMVNVIRDNPYIVVITADGKWSMDIETSL